MSSIVMKLQTVVSQEIAPQEPVMVTVGSFHAGTAENITSDRAFMKINIRALSTDALLRAYGAVTRIIKGKYHIFRRPEPPEIKSIGSFPLLENHETLTHSVVGAFDRHFKGNHYSEPCTSLGAEDFSNLAVEGAMLLLEHRLHRSRHLGCSRKTESVGSNCRYASRKYCGVNESTQSDLATLDRQPQLQLCTRDSADSTCR
jgi:metal-dependent amidase/aminoacylase/carboxypeptidase family protein